MDSFLLSDVLLSISAKGLAHFDELLYYEGADDISEANLNLFWEKIYSVLSSSMPVPP
jgi:hypothetical protein